MQTNLKKDIVCIYFFYWKSSSEFADHEKENETRGLQKVIGVRGRDQEKVRLYKNC